MGKGDNRRPIQVDIKQYEDNYTAIFGFKEIPNEREIEHARIKTVSGDVLKLGKEICRMSKLGEKHKHKELESDANSILHKPRFDPQLKHQIAKEVVERYKAERRKNG